MPKKVIGFDPGNRYFKAVELECGFRVQELSRNWRVPRSEERGGLQAFVSKSLGNGRPEGEVWTPLPLADITARLIKVPFSSASKLEKVVPFELESHVPFGAEELVVDHQFVEKEKNSSWILAAGVKRDRVKRRLDELGKAGLNPRGLVPEGHAYRSLARLMETEPGAPFAFLDIGATHSVFTVGLGERVVASRSMLPSGDDITEKIASRLSLSFQGAEELKVNGDVKEEVLLESVREALKPLASNIRNSLRYLAAEESISPPKIILCGGGALMTGLDNLLTEMIGIPCETVVFPKQFSRGLGPQDAHALALALEDLNPVHGVNFRKGEFVYRSEAALFKEKLVFPGILLVLIVFVLALNSLAGNRVKRAQLTTLEAKVSSVVQGVLPGEEVLPSEAIERLGAEIDKLTRLEDNLGQLQGLTPLELLTAISELIPMDLNVDLQEITLTDRLVILGGIIQEHSDMDLIVENLKNFNEFKRFDTPSLRKKVHGGVKFTQKIFLTEEDKED